MQRFLPLLLLLALLGRPALAADLVVAPPSQGSSGCDLAIAGFDTKEPFLRFFDQLQAAAKARDKAALAALVIYPLRVNAKQTRYMRKPADLEKNFDTVFTPQILGAIAAQKLDALFCNYSGIMYGNGEVWVIGSGERIGIISINLP